MAVPLARPQPIARRRILTASAMKLDPRDTETRRLQASEWQKKAFGYSKTIPELNYASRFYSKMLKRLKIYPAKRDAREALTPITEGLPVDLLERIQDPGGGRSQILGQYGRLMFIAGEAYLFGRDLETVDERWAIVSSSEIESSDGKIIWRPTESGSPKEYTGTQAVAYRLWTPDPERSGEAESPMKAVLEIADELAILTKAVRATATSRILNGILKVPAEISFGSDEPGLDDDPEENKFLADLIDHIVGAIENAGSAEAATPFLAEGAAEFLRELVWERMHDSQNDYLERELRAEAIGRFSVGLDMPPEILKGLADANHWGARQIIFETWRSHGAPVAEQFCDDMAEAYLRPALRDAQYEGWDSVVVAYDDSDVVVSPDRTEDADRAYDRGQISDAGYMELKGINKSLQASQVEKKIFLAVKLRDARFLKGTPFEVEDVTPVAQLPGPQPSKDAPNPAEDGPPNPGPAGVSRQESRSLALRGAAELALLRCRELAGSKIRQTHKRNAAVCAMIEGRQAAFVAYVLGQDMLIDLGTPEPLQLVKGGTDGFMTLCLEWGIEPTQAKALAQMIEVFAARTLFEPRLPQFESGFYAQIERAVEVSDARQEEVIKQNNHALARLSGVLGGEQIAVAAS